MALRNRIVMPAMDQNSCTDDGLVTDLTIRHYEARARGGAGLLILEKSAIAYPMRRCPGSRSSTRSSRRP